VTHDYAEECEASKTEPVDGEKCVFPIAQAYDSQDGKIDVTATIKLLDSDGVEMNMPVNTSNDNTDSLSLENPFNNKKAYTTRSTYIFNYDAADAAGNEAEQVTFALVFNDVTAPTISHTEFDTTVEYGKPDILSALTTILCEDNVDALIHPSVAVVTSESAKSLTHDCGDDMTGASITNCAQAQTTKIPFNSATPPRITVAITCEDHADIYGTNGTNNVNTKNYNITLQDKTPPVIACKGSNESNANKCSSEIKECIKSETEPFTPQTPATCYDSELVTEWAHEMLDVTSSNENDLLQNVTSEDGIKTTYSCNDGHDNDAVQWTQTFFVKDTTPPSVVIDYIQSNHEASVRDGDARADTNIRKGEESSSGYKSRTINENNTEAPGLVHMITPHGVDVVKMMKDCCQGDYDGTSTVCTPAYRFANHSTVTGDTCKDVMNGIETSWTCNSTSCNMEENINGIHITDLFNVSDSCSTDFNYSAQWITDFEPKIPGTYVRAYTFTDDANHSTTGHVNIVLQDPDAPILQMIKCEERFVVNGDGNTSVAGCFVHQKAYAITANMNYEDDGASCHDFVDGSLSHAVEVSGQVVDLSKPDTYIIHYNCQDLSGNEAETQTRTVIVEDKVPCTFNTSDVATQNYVEAGFPFSLDDEAVTCSDAVYGNINVTVNAACVENEPAIDSFTKCLNDTTTQDGECTAVTKNGKASVYHVTYSATDAMGNFPVAFVRTITVKDTLPPVITLSHDGTKVHSTKRGTGTSSSEHGGTTHNGLTADTKFEFNPANKKEGTSFDLPNSVSMTGTNPNFMAESSSVNGWLIAAVASAVTGVALLGFSSKRSNQVMVPV